MTLTKKQIKIQQNWQTAEKILSTGIYKGADIKRSCQIGDWQKSGWDTYQFLNYAKSQGLAVQLQSKPFSIWEIK